MGKGSSNPQTQPLLGLSRSTDASRWAREDHIHRIVAEPGIPGSDSALTPPLARCGQASLTLSNRAEPSHGTDTGSSLRAVPHFSYLRLTLHSASVSRTNR